LAQSVASASRTVQKLRLLLVTIKASLGAKNCCASSRLRTQSL
jgi:hypothetical protein